MLACTASPGLETRTINPLLRLLVKKAGHSLQLQIVSSLEYQGIVVVLSSRQFSDWSKLLVVLVLSISALTRI